MRGCLAPELCLVNLSMLDIDLRRAVIVLLSFACSSNIELDGDGAEDLKLRLWLVECFTISYGVCQ